MVEDPLPPADLLIVKHVLQHIPNRDVLKFLPQLKKYKHVLLVNSADPLFSGTTKTPPWAVTAIWIDPPALQPQGQQSVGLHRDVNAHVVLHLFQRGQSPEGVT